MTINNEDVTQIHIALPLPVDVAASLMLAVSQMYPSSRVSTENTRLGHMTFLVDSKERGDPAEGPEAEDEFLASKVYKEPDLESATLESIREDDGDFAATFGIPEGVSHQVALFCARLLSIPLAKNYTELQVQDAEGENYFLVACRSKGQSPAALHQAGVAKLAEIKDELLTLNQETFKGSPTLVEFLNS